MTGAPEFLLGEFRRTLDERYRLSVPRELGELLTAHSAECILAKERPGCVSLWAAAVWRARLDEGVELGTEGAVGLITYMRTDSTRVSDEALAAVREHITATYGADALPAKPRSFASKKRSQVSRRRTMAKPSDSMAPAAAASSTVSTPP